MRKPGRTIVRCILVLGLFLIACDRKPPAPEAASEAPSVRKIVIEKEKESAEQPLPSEVKIKLKRDGKESYSWELSGSDPDQVLKVNEKLRKRLGGEASK